MTLKCGCLCVLQAAQVPTDRAWVGTHFLGFWGRGSGVYFQLGALLWEDLASSGCIFEGRGCVSLTTVLPTLRREPGQEETSTNICQMTIC